MNILIIPTIRTSIGTLYWSLAFFSQVDARLLASMGFIVVFLHQRTRSEFIFFSEDPELLEATQEAGPAAEQSMWRKKSPVSHNTRISCLVCFLRIRSSLVWSSQVPPLFHGLEDVLIALDASSTLRAQRKSLWIFTIQIVEDQ